MEHNSLPNRNNTDQKPNMGLVVAAIAVIITLITSIIVLIIVIATRPSVPTGNTASSDKKDKETAIDSSNADIQREDDLARFLTAVNDYQANNSGKTPWSSGSTNPNFVRRYIDKNCTASTPEAADNNCSEAFRDPDGKPYHFSYQGRVTSQTVATSGVIKKDHGILVYAQAQCGKTKDGTITRGNGERMVALLYLLDSGEIACNDNH